MKHFISLVLAGVMTAVSVTFSSHTVKAETEHHDNVLITYFSRAGENYNVGVVERGNTDLLAVTDQPSLCRGQTDELFETFFRTFGGHIFEYCTDLHYESDLTRRKQISDVYRSDHSHCDKQC